MLDGNDLQHVGGLDRFALGKKPPQRIIHKLQPFVLGGVQQLEILLDRGSFRRVFEQLIISHAESRRGVHVMHVLVVDKRTWLADQGVDHVAKVDGFLAVAELLRHALDAFVPIPEFQVVLMNPHLQVQADILAADRVRVPFHANDAVGFHR